ncbi:type II secretion system protein [Acholeplasma equirhinis]|uniref:type II secretion system protein n=1 Tax=Acholeplasma equirhinis TaxID=555393 RepID=UPI00197AB689|nr:type II secretion system protein [Acholeplasma equirhinis]MBN3491226.1 type II secretion system protein [Acholeplasma equirhinis]
MNRSKKGFTLVELIVVIAIVAILSTVAVVSYTTFLESARNSKAQQEYSQLETVARSESLLNTDDPVHLVNLSFTVDLSVDPKDDAELVEALKEALETWFDDLAESIGLTGSTTAVVSASLSSETSTVTLTYTTPDGGKHTTSSFNVNYTTA